MCSTPSPTHLSATPSQNTRRHLHRRSGAISGDFDLAGLGLLSPPPPLNLNPNHTSSKSIPHAKNDLYSSHRRSYSSSFATQEDDILRRQFNFSNEEDFTNKPLKEDFEFPKPFSPSIASPSLTPVPLFSTNTPNNECNVSLNSPISFKKSEDSLTAVGCQKHFLTGKSIYDSHDIPDAVIDLDQVFHANLVLENKKDLKSDFQNTSIDIFESLGSQHFNSHTRSSGLSNQFPSSPFNSPAFLRQSIKEPANDAIEEEEYSEESISQGGIDDDFQFSGDPNDRVSNSVYPELENFSNPQNLHDLTSRNSSSSSVSTNANQFHLSKFTSFSMVEKTLSNSSKESSGSNLANVGSPAPRRSSAKAPRYQAFYDKSIKISSSLKYASTDSVHIMPTSKIEQNPSEERVETSQNSLGHSSSMPILDATDKGSPLSRRQANRLPEIKHVSTTAHLRLGKQPMADMVRSTTNLDLKVSVPKSMHKANTTKSVTLTSQSAISSWTKDMLLQTSAENSRSKCSLESIGVESTRTNEINAASELMDNVLSNGTSSINGNRTTFAVPTTNGRPSVSDKSSISKRKVFLPSTKSSGNSSSVFRRRKTAEDKCKSSTKSVDLSENLHAVNCSNSPSDDFHDKFKGLFRRHK